MAYCRTSTDDFKCDLYVFDHICGYIQVYIAAYRIVYKSELPPPLANDHTAEQFIERYNKCRDLRETADKVYIDDKYAGESFQFTDVDECIEFLKMLKERGYRFPDYVIEDLKEEHQCQT